MADRMADKFEFNNAITDLRRQAAYIKSLILYFQHIHNFSFAQIAAIEDLRIGFNKVAVCGLGGLRKACGDIDYKKVSLPDVIVKDGEWGLVTNRLIEILREKAADFQRAILAFPGDDRDGYSITLPTPNPIQEAIDELQQMLTDWRSAELGEFLNAFNAEI
jgi:hypothetical protein